MKEITQVMTIELQEIELLEEKQWTLGKSWLI